MGEATDLERPITTAAYPSASFEESIVESSPEIEATKANIEHTRSEMSETINAIKQQLSPKRLVEEAKEAVSDAVHEKIDEAKDAVKDKVSEMTHGASEAAMSVVASVSDAAHSISEKVSEMAGTAKDKLDNLTHPSGKSDGGNSNAALIATGAGAVAVAGMAGDTFKQTGDVLMATIKENPIPTALVGLGLGWLIVDAIMKRQHATPALVSGNNSYPVDTYRDTGYGVNRGASYGGYAAGTGTPVFTSGTTTGGVQSVLNQASTTLSATGEKIGDAVEGAKAKIADTAQDLQAKIEDTASDLQAKASGMAHTVQDKASETGALVSTKATELTHAAQTNARKAAEATQDFVTGNPLATGAIALLLGTVIGLALPSTEPENRLMGTYRDQLADQAGQQAQDLMGKVQNVAEDALNVAKEQLVDGKDSVKAQVTEVMESVQSQLVEAKDKVQAAVETSAKASKLVPA